MVSPFATADSGASQTDIYLNKKLIQTLTPKIFQITKILKSDNRILID
jgi:hypothetical protein